MSVADVLPGIVGTTTAFRLEVVARRGGPEPAKWLRPLYELGAQYHQARLALIEACDAGRCALTRMDSVAPDGAREAVREVLGAADLFRKVQRQLRTLVGMESVLRSAAACESILDSRSRSSATMTAASTLRGFGSKPTRREIENAFDFWIAWNRVVPERRQHGRRRVQERATPAATLRSVCEADPMPRDRAYVAAVEAGLPNAPGAIGIESIVPTDPCWPQLWACVAWLGWRSAANEIPWDRVWDCWPALDQFTFATIGAARGATAAAVGKNRGRQVLPP